MKPTHKRGKVIGIVLLVCMLLALAAGVGYYASSQGVLARFVPTNPQSALFENGVSSTSASVGEDAAESSGGAQDARGTQSAGDTDSLRDRSTTASQDREKLEQASQNQLQEEQAAADAAEAADAATALEGIPTPLIAEYDGVLLHSPIRARELEGILFHQASFETALPMETQLPEADPEAMENNPDYEIAREQPTGDEWLVAKALHLWREYTPTAMDTSVDLGAEAKTQVYAPVTGTVVLVNTYDLYDVVKDYEIHIQPDGRPDLDVVEIHIQDVSVKAGDRVIGGETPIAKVRDLAAEDITDIQLAYYSKEGHGNHTHVQVNDADYPEYRETRLKGAYKVKD